ncbi:MAG: hypothetical protein SWH54_09855, partial [Thermodesulfobacteriota bacterium]|nr:hypothetical protein [Thermodesulfobacteriota bacterium]
WILVTESALLPLIQKEHFLNTQHSFCHSPQLSWGFSSVIIRAVPGIVSVTYNIAPKPPSTIEAV